MQPDTPCRLDVASRRTARASSRPRHGLTRRHFLRTASGTTAAGLVAHGLGAPPLGTTTATAAMPEGAAAPSALRSLSVQVDRLPIHTLVSTDPPATAPPIILVHGLGLSGQYMVPTAELLAPDYPVYVPDFPGFGDSGKPGRALDVPGLADVLVAWMLAVGLDQATFLDNSFGCQIIADLAARYPERVDRAVLQGPTAPPDERTWFWQFRRWRANAPHNPPSLDPITLEDYRKAGPVRLFLTFQYSLDDRPEDKLPLVQAPTLVVRGELDPICSQKWAEEVTGRLRRGRLVVIPDVAHTLVYTAAPQLVAATREFLATTPETS